MALIVQHMSLKRLLLEAANTLYFHHGVRAYTEAHPVKSSRRGGKKTEERTSYFLEVRYTAEAKDARNDTLRWKASVPLRCVDAEEAEKKANQMIQAFRTFNQALCDPDKIEAALGTYRESFMNVYTGYIGMDVAVEGFLDVNLVQQLKTEVEDGDETTGEKETSERSQEEGNAG